MNKCVAPLLVGFAAASNAGLCVAAPAPGETTIIGPFTGHYAKLHPDNLAPLAIAYYGTDLGFSYEHRGKLQLLFGDTAANERGDPIQASTHGIYDDGFGTIDLTEWRDPARISSTHIPLIKLGQNPGSTEMSAINPGHAMESFKTPLGGFSNGDREFGLFYTSKPQGCRVDADCDSGLSCDTGLGFVGERFDKQEGITVACIDGRPGCNANTITDAAGRAVDGSGFCSDRTSSVWANTNVGRTSAIGVKQRVGVRSTTDPRIYSDTHDWLTNKFANVTVRTVQEFDVQRGAGRGHPDYRPAGGEGLKRRVLLWGRPGFIGVAATQRSLGLYFAYVDMPTGTKLRWDVHYFIGIDKDGAPLFSTQERDAIAVDLDATREGYQTTETYDIVDQMSVAWIAHLKKWVMFYGGGMSKLPTPPLLPNCGVLEFFTGAECKQVVVGNGAMHMRTADHPWGPWTPPQDLIVGGDPDAESLRDQYAVGGVLRHPRCIREGCAPKTNSPQLPPGDYGFLYGASIIEPWIKPVGNGVDVIWNASTWNPYRMILLRTRIQP
jgi:hypothetical protein